MEGGGGDIRICDAVEKKALLMYRLYRARGDDEPPPPLVDPVEETSTVELKSPLQLLSQVEQMHKEELDQVLHKLQHENRSIFKAMLISLSSSLFLRQIFR